MIFGFNKRIIVQYKTDCHCDCKKFYFLTPGASILQFSSFSPYQTESQYNCVHKIYHSFFDCPTIQYKIHPSRLQYYQRHSRIIADFYLNLNATSSWCHIVYLLYDVATCSTDTRRNWEEFRTPPVKRKIRKESLTCW